MQQTDIPNLDPATEMGFTLDTGELVAVAVFRPASVPSGVVAITVTARAVNPDGSTLVVAGQEVKMPGHTVSFMVEDLGETPLLVMPAIAAAIEQEARKVRGFLSALNSLSMFATR